MNYNHPDVVRSPRGYVKEITPLYDGGKYGFSIAILEDCSGNKNLGIRWNVSEKEWEDSRKTEGGMVCVGMPQSRGYSVWFILPVSFWQFVPKMIQIEIQRHKNLIDISDDKIQKEVNRIVSERSGE